MTGRFVSYAQNFEDVMLWRALRAVEGGFYIDVGAYSPTEHSVTHALYERGWHGINVEPNPRFHAELAAARTRDVNLCLALGDSSHQGTLHVVSDTGLTTLDDGEAIMRGQSGYAVRDIPVEVQTLRWIWAEHVPADQPVHFLKVDAEGSERSVLAGNDWERNRPWLVVMEATAPTTSQPDFEGWEPLLTGARYRFVYADGLNRWYLAEEHPELAAAFAVPPNIFDGFVRVSEARAQASAKEAQAQLRGVLASRSWRWVLPVRKAAALARALRGRLRPRRRS